MNEEASVSPSNEDISWDEVVDEQELSDSGVEDGEDKVWTLGITYARAEVGLESYVTI